MREAAVQADSSEADWEEDAPEWPDESAESAMAAELTAPSDVRVPTPRAPRRRSPADDDKEGDLPDLEAVVATIPADVRKTLDELFRAQFTQVRRVPEVVLKKAEPGK